MNSRLIALILALGCGAAGAENAEQRLLRSWGMQLDSDGNLRLAQPRSEAQATARWSPDLPAFHDEPNERHNQPIDPVRLNPAASAEIAE